MMIKIIILALLISPLLADTFGLYEHLDAGLVKKSEGNTYECTFFNILESYKHFVKLSESSECFRGVIQSLQIDCEGANESLRRAVDSCPNYFNLFS